jgi:colicin import membrane protein
MQHETVVAAVRQLRATGERISLRAIKAMTGGSYRDLGPLLKTILSAEEWSAVDLDVSEPPAPPPGQLKLAHAAVQSAEEAVGEAQNLLDERQARLRTVQRERPASTTDPHQVQDIVQAQLQHELEVLQLQKEVEALGRILEGRRAERDALRTDWQRLHERAHDLKDRGLPAVQRRLQESRFQCEVAERDAAHRVRLARQQVEALEASFAAMTAELARLVGTR